ncbi:hypothetical protein KEJ21_00245 [Candidatus Bathyarchaeota archaeon]|nr:hypothetical protein [Candidatus Bathyarchaeota archaeon]MBS7630197.1 hypothetical protein [Candidatus Bathyarchaeota archaeon]
MNPLKVSKGIKPKITKTYTPAEDDAPCRRTPLRFSCEERVTQSWYRRVGGRQNPRS